MREQVRLGLHVLELQRPRPVLLQRGPPHVGVGVLVGPSNHRAGNPRLYHRLYHMLLLWLLRVLRLLQERKIEKG